MNSRRNEMKEWTDEWRGEKVCREYSDEKAL